MGVMMLILFMERFILMMHFSSHRPIFKSEALVDFLTSVVAPIFGVPCGVYKVHHCLMHHIENNRNLDSSSTESLQRDSPLSYLWYAFRFVIVVWFDLFRYAYSRKLFAAGRQCFLGMATWLALIFLLWNAVNARVTFWILVLPYFVSMNLMSFGNWSQHIFVDPERPDQNFTLTYNCINTPANQTTFNDGYHIIHHMNARIHWTELPQKFLELQDRHHKEGSLTFRNIHFFEVGLLVMTGQLRKLADHYVHIGSKDTAPTKDEIVEKFRMWLKPVSEEVVEKLKKN